MWLINLPGNFLSFRFDFLGFFILTLASGCGDAFKRENFQRSGSLAGYTTLTIGGAPAAQVHNLLSEITNPMLTPAMDLQMMTVPSHSLALFATKVSLTDSGNIVIGSTDMGVPLSVVIKKLSSVNLGAGPEYKNANGTPVTLTLPNGDYSFAFVGYDNATMDSTMQCSLGTTNSTYPFSAGAGDTINLGGTDKTIYFKTGACGTRFRATNYTEVRIGVCTNATVFTSPGGLDSFSDAIALGKACNSSGLNGAIGTATHVKIGYAETNENGELTYPISASNAIISPCTPLDGTSGTTNTSASIHFALGNASNGNQTRLKTVLLTYSNSACDTLVNVFEFPKGIAAAASTDANIKAGSFIVRDSTYTQVSTSLDLFRLKVDSANGLATFFVKVP